MPERNTSPYEMFLRYAHDHKPQHAFSAGDVAQWRGRALPDVLATLGDLPPTVPPNPELIVEWQDDGVVTQKWLIDVQPHLSAVAYVLRPSDLAAGERRPGILCWHGHGPFGKEVVVGNDSRPELREFISPRNGDYARQMARAGFVTFAIDWTGRGDLDDDAKPNHRALARGRDWCNLYYLTATMLGMTVLGMNVAHGRALVDYAQGLPFVDSDRFGVMGLSGGGTMALWSALADERLGAIEIICYSDRFADFAYRDLNCCGLQVTPGLYKLVDVPDLQGLLAPRPLLVDIGVHDDCFRIESAMACHRRVREIYHAAHADDQLELDLFPGGHGWSGASSIPFFTRHLRSAP